MNNKKIMCLVGLFFGASISFNFDLIGELKDTKAQVGKLNTELREVKNQNTNLTTSNSMLDNTIELLKEELNKKPPTVDEQNAFYHASQVYNVDYKLLLAISQLETGFFTSDVYNNYNNVGGIKAQSGHNEYQYFNTKVESIYEMARIIRYNYLDLGLDTPSKMSYKYCPPTPESWARQVSNLMKEI
jgi:beta-N-acetylglucosaminidase